MHAELLWCADPQALICICVKGSSTWITICRRWAECRLWPRKNVGVSVASLIQAALWLCFSPKAETTSVNILFKSTQLENNVVCWENAAAPHAWLSQGKILTSHVAWSALITFHWTFLLDSLMRELILICLNRQIKPKCSRVHCFFHKCFSCFLLLRLE